MPGASRRRDLGRAPAFRVFLGQVTQRTRGLAVAHTGVPPVGRLHPTDASVLFPGWFLLRFSIILFYDLFFGWAGSWLLHGLFSSRSAQVSHCGFSCCRVQALGLGDFSRHGTWARQLQFPGSSAQALSFWA